MAKVAIIGASGYTGLELLRLFLRHPGIEVTTLVTRQPDAPHIADVHPSLRGRLDLRLEQLTPNQIAERADYAFACLPHAASAALIKQLLEAGLKVVDLSADYRLTDRAVYEKWYGVTHPDPDRLGKVAYGLPELYRTRIAESDLVANPGCYPTSAILALAPLLKAGVISAEGIVIDSKSGVSGGGRDPKPAFHFPECNESLTPYGVGTHRHMPEIDQVLSDACGRVVETVFTPHLIPMDRGILSTCYATPVAGVDQQKLLATLTEFYHAEPFVEVVEGLPATKHVAGSNRCHVTARLVRGRAVVISAIDNLIKGAAGAAVQNFNLMSGQAEATGLV
ncbi:MAG: N-acetyl-gamma-glutamyl-phosphate reductase [Planctomycetales bacterium]|nr:N-acetyl-gamma-glutamyl-phosphate reductase [Planctomycetales bacterium]